MSTLPNTIFVQIASYRDEQLVPTLKDLISHAASPSLLRIVVCWQHAQEERIDIFLSQGFLPLSTDVQHNFVVHVLSHGSAVIELIDIPHFQTQGVCWARNLIQQRYRGERYTLQLDAHHRFVDHWDSILVAMLQSLRDQSPKPVLTTYPPAFTPEEDPTSRIMQPTVMVFDRFNWEGFPVITTRYMADIEGERPLPSRFYAAGFAFADGTFSIEVQHDPNYFFLGEEMSIAARAFTHGYDFYHPNTIVLWHRYNLTSGPKICEDHTPDARIRGNIEMDWEQRVERGRRRFLDFFGMTHPPIKGTDFGPYGLGCHRSLTQYERYVGLSFAHRGAHPSAYKGTPPPTKYHMPDDQWLDNLHRSNEIRVIKHESDICHSRHISFAQLQALGSNGAVIQQRRLDRLALDHCLHFGWFEYMWSFTTELHTFPERYTLEWFDEDGQSLAKTGDSCPH